MSPIIRYFTVASLLYLLIGTGLGLIMAAHPQSIGYLLLAHVHFLLLGFIAMMIYSVGYHVLPRFSGFNLYSGFLVTVQFYLTNVGLIGMALTWIVFNDIISGFYPVLILGSFASMEFIGICIFVFNNIMTLSGKGGKMTP
jgi:cbb3-type cytochrome oxidase subunit 1